MDEKKPWRLHIGCHRRTLTSRDTDVREYDTLQECVDSLNDSESFWNSCGYVVWFAYAKGPNGQKIKLHQGNDYY